MMEDDPSASSYEATSLTIDGVESTVNNLKDVIAEEVSVDHVVDSHIHNSEGKLAVEFKMEPPASPEIGGMGIDQFSMVRPEETEVSAEQMGAIMKTEIVSSEGETSESRDIDHDEHVGPQQFIILTRTAEGEPLEDQGIPSKYIRFDGADGQTYVLAVTTDVGPEEATEPAKTLPSQQIVQAKSMKVGKKRVGSLSTTVPMPTSPPLKGKTMHNANVDGINQAWFTTRDDKNALHKEGHEWKQGQWTKEEVEVLEHNINSYCKEHNIKDPAEVIFEMSKDERKDFYRTIALGIHRPLFSVYRRVTRMYDRKNHRGKYTPSEMKYLRVLRAKHGNDWAAIGVALGRSASSVKDKCRLMKANCSSGKWHPEEESRLADAVYKLTGVKPSESITSGLSWANVAEHVGTRSEKQCRTKWLNYLNWKQQGGADWTRDDDMLLIEKVSNMNVNNDSEIDWVALAQDWKSVRSPQWLRGKWWALKRHIGDYNTLSYSALLDQMKQVICWNLKPRTGTRQAKGEVASVVGASHADIFKGCIPVSLTSDASGSLALSYCSSEEEGFQTFEVLQQWTPQMLSAVTQGGAAASGAQGIVSGEGHIIVRTLTPGIGETGQQQVIISTAGLTGDGDIADQEGMTIQVADNLVQTDQDLNTLSSSEHLHEGEISSTFESGGEEIVTVSELHEQPVPGDQDMMTHVFETVTSDSGGDLVLGVVSPTRASTHMTSLKDPILMSSSDVECEKSQHAELTDEAQELID